MLFPILDSLPSADGRSTAYARVRAELDRHRSRVDADDHTEDEDEADPLLALVHSPAEAVRLARERLPLVVIPEAATTSVALFDSMPEAAAWGRATWRALSALDAYASDDTRRAGFWDWCANSGSPVAWPATPKRLSMTECDTVKGAFLAERTFPVDARVRPEGQIVMLAHCKLGGGGTVAPRLYFHDDTKGMTGKIHVGFVGPHRDVPNASTN